MMVKQIIKTISLGSLIALSIIGCDDNTNELQTVASTGEKGAYARVLSISDDINANLLDTENSKWEAQVEFVDAQQGKLVESYSIYATFKDNTIATEDAPDNSIKNEVLISTWEKSSFTATETYPKLDIVVNAKDIISKLGLDLDLTEGGDSFVLRGEISLSDGRTFSSTNSGVSVNSELFFNDAFSFTSTLVCVPASPLTGDWKIEMFDNYGDGWNGGFITVTLDGVSTEYKAEGSETSVTFNVPAGTSSLTWQYTTGSWESENTFKIYAPSGNIVSSEGPSPNPGAIPLNLCAE
ncbi:hypothetical protein [Tenacibaculum salmonis]|uniref:hypothetical protein n=1 Tax=Tenacibaculum sp. P3-BQ1 TaxID=3232310 RepID=UPI0034DEA0B7